MVQRVSALYMLLFLLFALARFAVDRPEDYAAWRAWIGAGGMRIAAMVFCAALIAHAWVGMRDVVMDYVGPLPLRLAVLACLALALAGLLLWLLLILASA
jgi:succinate dehydrogenase / fumarate reductase membrane anchor subunit